jgi:hypothetical protein
MLSLSKRRSVKEKAWLLVLGALLFRAAIKEVFGCSPGVRECVYAMMATNLSQEISS